VLFSGLPGTKNFKRPNLAISSFKKGQILKNEKRPNKGHISFKKFVKITELKFRMFRICLKFAEICPKKALKYTIFVNIQRRPKNGQIIFFLTNSFKKGQI